MEHDERMSYHVDELPALSGVPITTIKKAIANRELPACPINRKVQVVLRRDYIAWLERYRDEPPGGEMAENPRRPGHGPSGTARLVSKKLQAERNDAVDAFDRMVNRRSKDGPETPRSRESDPHSR